MSQLRALLGNRRLLALGALGLVIAGLIFGSMALLNRPVYQTLYSGLDAEDVSRIGAVLNEVGITFDVNETGTAVLVDPGKAVQARMILAEKGLPKSDRSGYELFDQMGSMGLTSFMQQVTRVRALEGELVRTVQQIEGVKSARVHLALRSESALRNKEEAATASVIIRFDGAATPQIATTIRQIVAAAIPGVKPDDVNVSTTDGRVLAAAGKQENAEPNAMLELENRISAEIASRVESTLLPALGAGNLRVSVSAQINLDKQQTTQTNFDPESKVERSLRTVKSSDETAESDSPRQVSSDQNIPREVTETAASSGSSKKRENKEELINFEMNSKKVDTLSSGYRILRLSVAVIVNKSVFRTPEGATLDEAAFKARLGEIELLARSSAGIDVERKDNLQVSALEFIATPDNEALPPPGFMSTLQAHLGTIINALGLVVAILLVIFLGLRPGLKAISGTPSVTADTSKAISPPDSGIQIQSAPMEEPKFAAFPDFPDNSMLPGDEVPTPSVDKLNRMVGIDVDRAAQVLKGWLAEHRKEAA
jgi:flagellar M-ring protein FliF